jgi:hypothetical protein
MSRHSGTHDGDSERGDLAHRIEDYTGGAECTLYPAGCEADALVTRWITAEAGSFVDRSEMR